MRPTLFRRLVAGLAAFAFILTLGLQGMQVAAMATMQSDMSMSMMAASDSAAGMCANCDGSGKGAATQCQPGCALSLAVLPVAASISLFSQPVHIDAENVSFAGRAGTPEPHPPKSAVLL